jgi:urease accessory protein
MLTAISMGFRPKRAFTDSPMDEDLALVRLLQLASPVLPVGAYTYSQGLESAVHHGVVGSERGAARWIGDSLVLGIARWEAPALATMLRAWHAGDDSSVNRLDREFVASRETGELRAETLQMGHSLQRLLAGLDAFTAVGGYRERLAGGAPRPRRGRFPSSAPCRRICGPGSRTR